MTTPNFSRESVRYRITGRHSCPVCHGNLLRTWRRPLDRFSSQFVPVQRYRCESFACQWEGNFRVERLAERPFEDSSSVPDPSDFHCVAEQGSPRRVPRSLVVQMALALAGVVFVVVFTSTDWIYPSGPAGAEVRDGKWLASVRLAGEGTQIKAAAQKTAAPVRAGAATEE